MRPGSVVREARIGPLLRQLAANASTVLDVGGYDGSVSAGARSASTQVVVVDLDGSGLEKARNQGLAGVRGSAIDLPLARRSVDVALALDVLPCVPAELAARVYPEIARVLKAGGHLVVTEMDERFKLPFVANEVAFARWEVKTGGFSYDALVERLEESGFTVVDHRMFYGVVTRFAYAAFFFWNVPSRGYRLKLRAWRMLARLERVWCPAPQAHLVVATVADGAVADGQAP